VTNTRMIAPKLVLAENPAATVPAEPGLHRSAGLLTIQFLQSADQQGSDLI
jgi:hypothetical protein